MHVENIHDVGGRTLVEPTIIVGYRRQQHYDDDDDDDDASFSTRKGPPRK